MNPWNVTPGCTFFPFVELREQLEQGAVETIASETADCAS
jgi:hypothetical protein